MTFEFPVRAYLSLAVGVEAPFSRISQNESGVISQEVSKPLCRLEA
jgi:hypothetical protein